MTETRTTRFGLPQWSAGTDSPSRTDFNEAFGNTEARAAYDTGEDYTSLPVSGLVAGRYAMLTVSGDGYSLYRYSGAVWQFVGGTLVPRFQRFKATEGQALTDAAFAVEHPSQVNANIVVSYGGDFTAGGVLKSWNANDSGKGALVVGWNGAVSLATTGRAYIRSRVDGDLGLVLHAHGAGAGNMLTVREPGNSDMFTVDAVGRLTQRTFAAFGEAGLPSTSMVAIAPTSAADSIVNGLLLYGQSAAASKDIMRALRDSADTAPILAVGRDGITVGRTPWTASMSAGHVVVSGNRVVLRASGVAGNSTYFQIRRSDPTSAVTEANTALDTVMLSAGPTRLTSDLPVTLTQRLAQSATTLRVQRVTDFTAAFVELSRLVPDGGGGETTQLASTWGPDGRLAVGAWWRSTGVVRDARQPVVHTSRKWFAGPTDLGTVGQAIDTGQTFAYTWATMTTRSSTVTDLVVTTALEFIAVPNPTQVDTNDFTVETFVSVNGGSFLTADLTHYTAPVQETGARLGGDVFVTQHRITGIPLGATFALRTQIAVGNSIPDFRLRMLDISVTESVVETYTAP